MNATAMIVHTQTAINSRLKVTMNCRLLSAWRVSLTRMGLSRSPMRVSSRPAAERGWAAESGASGGARIGGPACTLIAPTLR